jgi:dihydroneopterin aldolase
MSRDIRITLSGVRLKIRIGVTQEERQVPQECHADVSVWGDFASAVSADALDQGFDYCQVLSAVLEKANARQYNLLESLAHSIAQEILRSFPARRVSVKVRKRPSALVESLDFIEVEVEES